MTGRQRNTVVNVGKVLQIVGQRHRCENAARNAWDGVEDA
jgi:hypothetical protein